MVLKVSSPSGATAATTRDARGIGSKNMAHRTIERAMLIALSKRVAARRNW
jgi:hypothetical protein